jgi:hypothetical protein
MSGFERRNLMMMNAGRSLRIKKIGVDFCLNPFNFFCE